MPGSMLYQVFAETGHALALQKFKILKYAPQLYGLRYFINSHHICRYAH
jgi:hypothetical protein